MLATNIKTTSELMSIALNAEREAIQRYTQLADKMHTAGNESVAELFQRLANEEQEHERLLLKWMKQEAESEHPDTGPISWKDPHVLGIYNDEARDPYMSSPYKALAFAVHNEEIAFSFYTHVAADSDNPAVREYAEILAREELAHAALLRAARRRAYHHEKRTQRAEPRLDPSRVRTEDDLLKLDQYFNYHIYKQLQHIRIEDPTLLALSSDLQKRFKDYTPSLDIKASAGDDAGMYIEQLKSYDTKQSNKPYTHVQRLQQLLALCDRSFAFYDAITQTTDNESVLLEAQRLSSSMLDRISTLKFILVNTQGSASEQIPK